MHTAERREILLSVFQHAIAAVHGRTRVRSALSQELLAQEALAHEAYGGPWRVIAVGKAAGAMTLGALDALGARVVRALVVTKTGHVDRELDDFSQVTCLQSGHPVPDERSLAAGAALLDEIAATPAAERLLFLVSGGASSLVEVPVSGVSLARLGEFNRWALASGLDIRTVNAVRQRLSAIKGGRLWAHVGNRQGLALFISDVPGNDPAVIGSGLFGAPVHEPLPDGVPAWVRELTDAAPAPAGATSSHITRRVVASLEDAVAAACERATQRGLSVRCAPVRFQADAVELASRFCHELALGGAQLHVWGGESTVRLPAHPGRGGRNQQLALAAARLLESHEDLVLLAAGTDGTDGPTEDAGAIVDAGTIERGTLDGLDADDCLARADAAPFLEAAGDLVHTGPTGTNVGDLVLGLKAPAS